MIHRRLLKDDGRGVGEPLSEPGIDGQGLTITGTHYIVLAPSASLVDVTRTTATQVFAPSHVAIAPLTTSVSSYISSHHVTASWLLNDLPRNLLLMTCQVSDSVNNIVLLRIAHQFGVGEDSGLSVPVTIDLGAIFSSLTVSAVTELTLTANQKLGAHKGYQWKVAGRDEEDDIPEKAYNGVRRIGASFMVTINPAEIRTFNLTLAAFKPFSQLQ